MNFFEIVGVGAIIMVVVIVIAYIFGDRGEKRDISKIEARQVAKKKPVKKAPVKTPEKPPEVAPDWFMLLLAIGAIVLIAYPLLVMNGVIDPYANQRRELNFTIRFVKPFEDPRWTQDRWLVTAFDNQFFLEGNFTGDQLVKGETYRIIYKNVEGPGMVPFYYAFTLEHIS